MNAITPVTMPLVQLTKRWTPMRQHELQWRYYHSKHRFNCVPAGRRSGKTEIAKRRLINKALRGSKFENPRYFAAAPVRQQAKDIYWEDLKRLVPDWMKKGSPSESELVIRLITGTEIHVEGLDKPERIEGQPWDGGILDEYGNMKEKAWPANVRPALADRNGYCDLIGVPEGRNHYYETYLTAKTDDSGTWGCYHWKSADILPPEEIKQARRDLDELTYLQEYEADFVNFSGRAYYTFDIEKHVGDLRYDKRFDLVFTFDFNVAPGVANIIQEQRLPNGKALGSGIIGEVHIPQNSNTNKVCDKLIEDWGEHEGRILCYGDATGGAGGSAKVEGSDWDLIYKKLKPVFKDRLFLRNALANPPEAVRVTSVNSRILSIDGTIRMMVDRTCKETIKDFDGVVLEEGGARKIDKKKTPLLTHHTDGIGYYFHEEFPISDRTVQIGKTS